MSIARFVMLTALVGCGSSKDAGKESSEDGEAVARAYIAKSAGSAVVKLEQAIASDKPSTARYDCAHMANLADLKKADAALGAKFEQLCTKDLHLAIIKVAVGKAEAARAAKPDEPMLSECFSAELEVAKQEMTEAKTIGLANELVARFEKVCPPSK